MKNYKSVSLYSQNKMFYSDYVLNHIYSATLDTGDDVKLLLNDSIEVPGILTMMYAREYKITVVVGIC